MYILSSMCCMIELRLLNIELLHDCYTHCSCPLPSFLHSPEVHGYQLSKRKGFSSNSICNWCHHKFPWLAKVHLQAQLTSERSCTQLLNDRTVCTCGWDFILVEHFPKINKWSLPVRVVVPVSMKISGFVVNCRSIRICEWFVMWVETDITCLRLLSSVVCCSLSASTECASKLRLKSPINKLLFILILLSLALFPVCSAQMR